VAKGKKKSGAPAAGGKKAPTVGGYKAPSAGGASANNSKKSGK
jgi:hypothetical protein